jgi:hypothetical protein
MVVFVYESLNMLGLLSNCTIVEHWAVILFFCGQLAILKKCGGLLSMGVVSFQNNVYSYSMAANVEAVRQLKFELLPCPLYSAYLGPSDYHMFGLLKEALYG